MNCQERQDLMLPYAAELLDEAQQQEIRAHLESGCPACQAALVEAQKLLEQIPASVDPVTPPADAVKKLMQRVKSEQAMPMVRSRFSFRWAAVAACIGFLLGALSLHLYERNDQQLADMKELLHSQQLKMVSLSSADQSQASGRVMWDRDHNRWHVTVFNLKPPPPGRSYELWFIKPDQTKIAAGMLDVDSNGNATTMVDVPKNIGAIAVAAVTDEPAGGVAQPTPEGKVHLAGNVE